MAVTFVGAAHLYWAGNDATRNFDITGLGVSAGDLIVLAWMNYSNQSEWGTNPPSGWGGSGGTTYRVGPLQDGGNANETVIIPRDTGVTSGEVAGNQISVALPSTWNSTECVLLFFRGADISSPWDTTPTTETSSSAGSSPLTVYAPAITSSSYCVQFIQMKSGASDTWGSDPAGVTSLYKSVNASVAWNIWGKSSSLSRNSTTLTGTSWLGYIGAAIAIKAAAAAVEVDDFGWYTAQSWTGRFLTEAGNLPWVITTLGIEGGPTIYEADGTTSVTFSPTGSATYVGVATATSALTFTPDGSATYIGTAEGSTSLTASLSASAVYVGLAEGISGVTFSPTGSGTFVGVGSASTSVTFTLTGDATLIGGEPTVYEADGSVALAFGAAGTALLIGSANGATSLTFTPTGALTYLAVVSATTGVSFTTTATATYIAQASGSGAVTFTATATARRNFIAKALYVGTLPVDRAYWGTIRVYP